MAHEIDVLIICAESDNQHGWIASFRNYFNAVVSYVNAGDQNVVLKTEFDSITAPSLDNASALVCIVTPAFVQSKNCLEYLSKFALATQDTANRVNRIFSVFKAPVPPGDLPDAIRDLFGYEMFNVDGDAGGMHEFEDYFTPAAERQYWMQMVDLCFDISNTLAYLNSGKSLNEGRTLFDRKAIYLAQTGQDLTVQRNIIHRELKALGYNVFPQRPLPAELHSLESAVKGDLAQCGMSIHLIGTDHGQVPPGTERSSLELQNTWAIERGTEARAQKEEFPHYIWISNDLAHAGDRQQKFIENLRRDVETSDSAEILQTQLEEFKAIIREELLEQATRGVDHSVDGQVVYVIFDSRDTEQVLPLTSGLERAGLIVETSSFGSDILSIRRKHLENLQRADAAIIVQGTMDSRWVRMKALDLLKSPGYGRRSPLDVKVIVSSQLEKEPFGDAKLKIIPEQKSPPEIVEIVQHLLKD